MQIVQQRPPPYPRPRDDDEQSLLYDDDDGYEDEYDDDDLIYTKLDNNNYSFEGKTPLKDVYKIVGINDDEIELKLK